MRQRAYAPSLRRRRRPDVTLEVVFRPGAHLSRKSPPGIGGHLAREPHSSSERVSGRDR